MWFSTCFTGWMIYTKRKSRFFQPTETSIVIWSFPEQLSLIMSSIVNPKEIEKLTRKNQRFKWLDIHVEFSRCVLPLFFRTLLSFNSPSNCYFRWRNFAKLSLEDNNYSLANYSFSWLYTWKRLHNGALDSWKTNFSKKKILNPVKPPFWWNHDDKWRKIDSVFSESSMAA